MSDKIIQRGVNAGKVVAAGDVEYTEETHHHYAAMDFSELDDLIKTFQEDEKQIQKEGVDVIF